MRKFTRKWNVIDTRSIDKRDMITKILGDEDGKLEWLVVRMERLG